MEGPAGKDGAADPDLRVSVWGRMGGAVGLQLCVWRIPADAAESGSFSHHSEAFHSSSAGDSLQCAFLLLLCCWGRIWVQLGPRASSAAHVKVSRSIGTDSIVFPVL